MFSIMKYAESDGKRNTSITLKAARINAGLTQDEAAQALGISKSNLLTWESHPGEIKVKYLPRIEEVYGYPLSNINFCSER